MQPDKTYPEPEPGEDKRGRRKAPAFPEAGNQTFHGSRLSDHGHDLSVSTRSLYQSQTSETE